MIAQLVVKLAMTPGGENAKDPLQKGAAKDPLQKGAPKTPVDSESEEEIPIEKVRRPKRKQPIEETEEEEDDKEVHVTAKGGKGARKAATQLVKDLGGRGGQRRKQFVVIKGNGDYTDDDDPDDGDSDVSPVADPGGPAPPSKKKKNIKEPNVIRLGNHYFINQNVFAVSEFSV